MQKYDEKVFRRLAGITGYDDETLGYQVKVEGDGVYPIDGLDILPSQWRWKPRHALAGKPGVTSAGPALAFDFNAADLATFLLTHSAVFLTEVWGGIEEGPLGLLEPDDYEDAADAAIVLKHAYQLLQNAITKVGKPPSQELFEADEANQAFANAWDAALEEHKVFERGISVEETRLRHAAATDQTTELKAIRDQLKETSAQRLKHWRKAMTQLLLMGEMPPASTDQHPVVVAIKERWSLKKDFRPRDFSYTAILRQTMKGLIYQNIKPTAATVLAVWQSKKPDQILEAKDQYFIFQSANNASKRVMRKDLQNAIDRQLICHSSD